MEISASGDIGGTGGAATGVVGNGEYSLLETTVYIGDAGTGNIWNSVYISIFKYFEYLKWIGTRESEE